MANPPGAHVVQRQAGSQPLGGGRGAVGVALAGNDESGYVERHRDPPGERTRRLMRELRSGRVRRGHQEQPADGRAISRVPAGGGQAAQAVGDQHHRGRIRPDGAGNRLAPVVKVRLIPGGRLDPGGGRSPSGLSDALPMVLVQAVDSGDDHIAHDFSFLAVDGTRPVPRTPSCAKKPVQGGRPCGHRPTPGERRRRHRPFRAHHRLAPAAIPRTHGYVRAHRNLTTVSPDPGTTEPLRAD